LRTCLTGAALSLSARLAAALSGQTDTPAMSSPAPWGEQGADVPPCLWRRHDPSTLRPIARTGKNLHLTSKTGHGAYGAGSSTSGNSSFLLLFTVRQSIPCYSTQQGIHSPITGSSIALNRAEAHHNRRLGMVR
jgi:hypothetical protein